MFRYTVSSNLKRQFTCSLDVHHCSLGYQLTLLNCCRILPLVYRSTDLETIRTDPWWEFCDTITEFNRNRAEKN
jgi:hypothetical protein